MYKPDAIFIIFRNGPFNFWSGYVFFPSLIIVFNAEQILDFFLLEKSVFCFQILTILFCCKLQGQFIIIIIFLHLSGQFIFNINLGTEM